MIQLWIKPRFLMNKLIIKQVGNYNRNAFNYDQIMLFNLGYMFVASNL